MHRHEQIEFDALAREAMGRGQAHASLERQVAPIEQAEVWVQGIAFVAAQFLAQSPLKRGQASVIELDEERPEMCR